MNHHFKFFVSPEHLSQLARQYGGGTAYIDVSYSILKGTEIVSIYYYGAGEVMHKNILWSPDLYREIQEAAENNYLSLYQSKKEYANTGV